MAETPHSSRGVAGPDARVLAEMPHWAAPSLSHSSTRNTEGYKAMSITCIFLFVSISRHIYFVHLKFTREAHCGKRKRNEGNDLHSELTANGILQIPTQWALIALC